MDDVLFDLAGSLGLFPESISDAINRVQLGRYEDALYRLRAAEQSAELLRVYVVQALRRDGRTWAEIGPMLGVSAQRAHQVYSSVDTAVIAGGNNLTRSRGYKKGKS